MNKNIIKYIFILIILYLFWNLLLGYFPFLLFLLFIILMIGTYMLCYQSMIHTHVEIICNHMIHERQKHMNLTFIRKDSHAIQCGKICLKYRVMNHNQCLIQRQITIEDDQSIDIISLPHCGYYTIEVTDIQCFDIFQCFCHKRRLNKKIHFYVFPSFIHVNALLKDNERYHIESDQYSPYVKGDDYAEVFDIRPYRETDSLKHIHWKVSMKKNELYVKEGSQPIIKKLLLAIEFRHNNYENDCALDNLYSQCLLLSKRQIQFELLCPQGQQDIYESVLICNQEHLKECIKRLLNNPTYDIINHLPKHSTAYVFKAKEIEVYEK